MGQLGIDGHAVDRDCGLVREVHPVKVGLEGLLLEPLEISTCRAFWQGCDSLHCVHQFLDYMARVESALKVSKVKFWRTDLNIGLCVILTVLISLGLSSTPTS